MTVIQHGGAGESSYVVDRFEATDLGAPFKVVLHNAVTVTPNHDGGTASYRIPNLDGLIRTVVIKRILHGRKLSGADIRFIRRALGMKQKDMAQRIETSPEHLSRCEAGTLVMSATTEKLLRIYALKTAIKLHNLKPCEAKTQLEEALDSLFDDVKSVAAYDATDLLQFDLSLCVPKAANDENYDPSGKWDDGNPPPKMAALR